MQAVRLRMFLEICSGRTYGVVMIISESTSSLSNVDPLPSLSEVVMRVWP